MKQGTYEEVDVITETHIMNKFDKNEPDKYLTSYTCPCCGLCLSQTQQGGLYKKNETPHKFKYCYDSGQHLNWEKKKEK